MSDDGPVVRVNGHGTGIIGRLTCINGIIGRVTGINGINVCVTGIKGIIYFTILLKSN